MIDFDEAVARGKDLSRALPAGLREQDLRIDLYRNAGAWGTLQDVSVRITHMPTMVQGTGRDDHNAYAAKYAAMTELLANLRAGGHIDGEDHPDDPQAAAES